MRCVICHHGKTRRRHISQLFERDGRLVIIRGVPADVCQDCGEIYFDADVTARLLEIVEQALQHGMEVAVENYTAA